MQDDEHMEWVKPTRRPLSISVPYYPWDEENAFRTLYANFKAHLCERLRMAKMKSQKMCFVHNLLGKQTNQPSLKSTNCRHRWPLMRDIWKHLATAHIH